MEQKRSIFYLLFNHIGNLIDQAFAFLPAKTGIGDGLSVAVLSDLMAAGLHVAFNHQALYQMADIVGVAAAVKYLFCNAHLLFVLFVGVGMIGVHDAGRIFKLSLGIEIIEQP